MKHPIRTDAERAAIKSIGSLSKTPSGNGSMAAIRLSPVTAGLPQHPGRGEKSAGESGVSAGLLLATASSHVQNADAIAFLRSRQLTPLPGMGRPATNTTPLAHGEIDIAPAPVQGVFQANGPAPEPARGRGPLLVHKRPQQKPDTASDPVTNMTTDRQQTSVVVRNGNDGIDFGNVAGTIQTQAPMGRQLDLSATEAKRIADDVYRMIEKKLIIERERRGL